MDRRRFLIACVAAGVAGCAGETESVDTQTTGKDTGSNGGSNSEGTPTDSPTPEPTPTEEPTPTGTPTPAGEAEVVIEDSSLQREKGEFSSQVYVLGQVTNQATVPSGSISLTARFYDSDDNLVENGRGHLEYLPAGATWQAVVPFLGTEPSKIAGHELTGEFTTTSPQFNPENVTLEGSQLERGENQATVTGRATNNRPGALTYLEANALFKAKDGTVLASGLANVSDLPSGDTWKFTTSWITSGSHPKTPQKHEARLTTMP